jgi:hypothetical protein
MTASNDHPSPFLFEKDRTAALNAVGGGHIVGKGSRPRLEGNKFMMDLRICNKVALEQQRSGTLSLSSAFIGTIDANKRLTAINRPDHILLFSTSSGSPKDKSVVINKIGDFNMSKKIILCDNNKELTFWNNILKNEIAAGTHEVKLNNADDALEADGITPTLTTLARAGIITYRDAGLVEDTQTEERNKVAGDRDPLWYDPIEKKWG